MAMALRQGEETGCLFGSVVQEDGSVRPRQWVQVSGGRILAVSDERPLGVVKPTYTLADDELLFPSFLDLHTHSTYNMLPLWHSPVWAWDNRFQWRANPDYKRTISATNRAIQSAWGHGSKIYKAFNAFSELMALAGGTTVLQENQHLDAAGYPTDTHLLIRSTGSPSDMGMARNEDVASITDWFEPDPWTAPHVPPQDTSSWKVKEESKGGYGGATYLADFAASVTGTRSRGTIVHLAEGRSGWYQSIKGVDAYSRKEFETFKTFLSRQYTSDDDVARVRDARLILIHGCGMNTLADPPRRARSAAAAPATTADSTRQETLDFLQRYGISLIWSPVSNLLLYQDTTAVLPLLDAGLPVLLGTDWTPSGSKTVWEEAKFATLLLQARGWKGNAALTCFRAVTSAAADSLGLPLGRVKAGNMADFVIVRRPTGAKRGDALATFLQAGDEHVRGVFVGGVPLYGEADVLQAFGRQPLQLPGEDAMPGSAAASKFYSLPDGCGLKAEDLAGAVQAADHVVGRKRPRLLVRDDADYQARMHELRRWVKDFDPKTSPTPRPRSAPPTGLAPGEQEWMYNPSNDPAQRTGDDVVDLLGRIAPCRDLACAVPKRHPYYHAEVLTQAGDSYGMRVPCMPVVPVLTNRGQLFVMGDYPTAKFTARSTNNLPVLRDRGASVQRANAKLAELLRAASAQPHAPDDQLQTYTEELADIVRQAWARPDLAQQDAHGFHRRASDPQDEPPRKNEFFVPVGDVFAPMQDANYFDGYKVRNVAAGVFMQEAFLKPVGVDVNRQVWLTNLIKCFLFHPSMAASYTTLGWTDVKVEASYAELLPVGQVCRQWVDQEVALCAPQLVLTVGKPPCTLLHGVPLDQTGVQGRVYSTLLGHMLVAGDTKAEKAIAKNLKLDVPIVRSAPWGDYNVFHMLHPQAVMMSQTALGSGLIAAITARLGADADGLDPAALMQAARKVVRKSGLTALLSALPHGLRDQFHSNAQLLQTHAVSMANLADTLARLKIVPGARAEAALKQQAEALAGDYLLAPDADQMLAQLKTLRDQGNERFAKLTH